LGKREWERLETSTPQRVKRLVNIEDKEDNFELS
jgi:hypothetical protein